MVRGRVDPLVGTKDEDEESEESEESKEGISIVSSICVAKLSDGRIELVQMKGVPEPDMETLSKMATHFFMQSVSAFAADHVGSILNRELPGMVRRILSEKDQRNGSLGNVSEEEQDDFKN
jgi:hypothetical protein